MTLVSKTDGIDSSTPAGRMMIGVLGSLAEYERELTKERTALKRASSRANGAKFGGPARSTTSSTSPPQADEGGRAHRQGHRQVPRGEPGTLGGHELEVIGRAPAMLPRSQTLFPSSSQFATTFLAGLHARRFARHLRIVGRIRQVA